MRHQMISQLWTGKNAEGTSHSLIWSNIPAYLDTERNTKNWSQIQLYKPSYGPTRKTQAGKDSGQDWDPGHHTYKAGVPATAVTTFSINVCYAANNTFRKHVHSNVVHNSAVIISSHQKSSHLRKPQVQELSDVWTHFLPSPPTNPCHIVYFLLSEVCHTLCTTSCFPFW